MKKNSYNHDEYMKAKITKISAASSETTYGNAMKLYKRFAYLSGAALTAAYIVLLLM